MFSIQINLTFPQNKKVAAAQEQKMKKGILTDANYSLNGNDTIVRYFWVDIQGDFLTGPPLKSLSI